LFIKTTFLSIDNVKKNGANYLIINGTKQTEDNIIKIPLTKRSYLKSLKPEADKEIWFRGKKMPWKLPLEKLKKSNTEKSES
jgi:hypothetical protein